MLPDIPLETTALFLDIDGTLLDVAREPDAVAVPDGLVDTIERIRESLDGALAIITGRPIPEVDRLFSPLKLVAGGVHGSELRREMYGKIEVLAPSFPTALIEELEVLCGASPGILLEVKGTGVAIHYRQAPAAAAGVGSALQAMAERSLGALRLTPGRMVFELLPACMSKGTALEALMTARGFAGRRAIVIGDDVSDESAFRVAESAGGLALRVRGEHFTNGATDFSGPAEVRAWLDQLAPAQPSRHARCSAM